jgi:hypothetical protein
LAKRLAGVGVAGIAKTLSAALVATEVEGSPINRSRLKPDIVVPNGKAVEETVLEAPIVPF